MKNFPDHNQFDELEKRLQAYTEQPDDLVWENIDASLRTRRPLFWMPWLDYLTATISILVCTLAIGTIQLNDPLPKGEIAKEHGSAEFQQRINETLAGTNAEKAATKNPEVSNGTPSNILTLKKSRVIGAIKNDGPVAASFTTSKTMELPSFLSTTESQSQAIEQKEQFPDMQVDDTLMKSVDVRPDSVTQGERVVKQAKRIPKRRPSFYASVTPSLSFQRAVPVGSDQIVVKEISSIPILSAERFGVSLDVGIQGFITKRFEYYSGLSFYHQNQALKYSYQSHNLVDVESSGDNNYTVTPKSSTGIIDYEMLNLGVQAGVLYNLYGKKLSHKIGAGLGYQHGFKRSNSQAYENSESSYFSYQVFYRNEVRVGPRLRFFVQPVFSQSIQVDEKLDAPFNLKPYRAGVGFGILYDF